MFEKRQILLLAKNYPPQIGGIERYSQEIYLKLLNENYEVILLKSGVRNTFFLRQSNIFYKFLYFILEFLRLFSFLLKSLILGSFYAQKSRTIWGTDGSLAPIIWFLGLISGKKTQITCHALDVTWHNLIYQFCMPFFWGKMDHIICVHPAIKDFLINKKKLSFNSIQVINNSDIEFNFPEVGFFNKVDFLNNIGVPQGKIILFSLGRFVHKKGFHWFLAEVLPNLDSCNYHYILAGLGEMKGEYEDIIIAKGIKNITFLGAIYDDILKGKLYSVADYFIMPNIFISADDQEGYPIVLLESKFYNCKIIVADLPPLCIDGVYVLPSGDKKSWIDFFSNLPKCPIIH